MRHLDVPSRVRVHITRVLISLCSLLFLHPLSALAESYVAGHLAYQLEERITTPTM